MRSWMVVAAVVGLVACAGDKSGTDLTGDPVAGEAIFADNCAVCHGADGTGGSGPDVTGESDEAEIREIVTDGSGEMTAFGDLLSEQEIADVAAYVAQSL